MDIQTNAVSSGMSEILAVSGGGDQVTGCFIDLAGCNAGFDDRERFKLRFQNDLLDFPHFIGSVTDGDGSGGIAVISLINRAEVKGDKIAFFYGVVTRNTVRQ